LSGRKHKRTSFADLLRLFKLLDLSITGGNKLGRVWLIAFLALLLALLGLYLLVLRLALVFKAT
jgi:hypothetical protein